MRTILETDKDFICDIQAPCFQMLSTDEINLVRSSKTQILFRKGDNLTKQGAFASYILFVITGYARQYIEGNNGKTFNFRIIQPGDFVGLSTVFTDYTFKYSSIALTECQVFLIEKDVVEKLARQNAQFAFNIIRRYCEQNISLYETIDTVLYKQMNGRLAKTLLYLDSFRIKFPEIFQILSRKDIADFAGISTENTVKLLKSYEKDGLLQLQEKDIILLKKDELISISKLG